MQISELQNSKNKNTNWGFIFHLVFMTRPKLSTICIIVSEEGSQNLSKKSRISKFCRIFRCKNSSILVSIQFSQALHIRRTSSMDSLLRRTCNLRDMDQTWPNTPEIFSFQCLIKISFLAHAAPLSISKSSHCPSKCKGSFPHGLTAWKFSIPQQGNFPPHFRGLHWRKGAWIVLSAIASLTAPLPCDSFLSWKNWILGCETPQDAKATKGL